MIIISSPRSMVASFGFSVSRMGAPSSCSWSMMSMVRALSSKAVKASVGLSRKTMASMGTGRMGMTKAISDMRCCASCSVAANRFSSVAPSNRMSCWPQNWRMDTGLPKFTPAYPKRECLFLVPNFRLFQ